jgi:hypothetical protein
MFTSWQQQRQQWRMVRTEARWGIVTMVVAVADLFVFPGVCVIWFLQHTSSVVQSSSFLHV